MGYRTRFFKNRFQKVVHKRGEFIGNIIADKIVKPKHLIDEDLRNNEEIIIPPQKKRRIIKRIKTRIIKITIHYKTL